MSGTHRDRMPRRAVTAWEMRRRFNEDLIWERVVANELIAVDESRRPGGSQSGQPEGTTSVLVRIFTPGLQLVAIVHYFERPDGTNSLPDPKYMVVDGEIWKIRD